MGELHLDIRSTSCVALLGVDLLVGQAQVSYSGGEDWITQGPAARSYTHRSSLVVRQYVRYRLRSSKPARANTVVHLSPL